MKLYRYWAAAEQSITDAEGNRLHLKKWGGSNDNEAEARSIAERAVAELARRLQLEADIRAAHEYTYSTRDLPEELIETLDASNGITRNRYGCLVLNSTNLMIADVDFRSTGIFSWLFHRKIKPKNETEALVTLKRWLAQHPEANVLVYRTAAGLRYLFTHALIAPNEVAFNWLRELGSDRLYTFLCKEQQSFRARLSPKPWRVAQERPPGQLYPFKDAAAETTFRNWLAAYESKAAGYATCHFLGQHGSGKVDAALQAIIAAHDSRTRARSTLPLA